MAWCKTAVSPALPCPDNLLVLLVGLIFGFHTLPSHHVTQFGLITGAGSLPLFVTVFGCSLGLVIITRLVVGIFPVILTIRWVLAFQWGVVGAVWCVLLSLLSRDGWWAGPSTLPLITTYKMMTCYYKTANFLQSNHNGCLPRVPPRLLMRMRYETALVISKHELCHCYTTSCKATKLMG